MARWLNYLEVPYFVGEPRPVAKTVHQRSPKYATGVNHLSQPIPNWILGGFLHLRMLKKDLRHNMEPPRWPGAHWRRSDWKIQLSESLIFFLISNFATVWWHRFWFDWLMIFVIYFMSFFCFLDNLDDLNFPATWRRRISAEAQPVRLLGADDDPLPSCVRVMWKHRWNGCSKFRATPKSYLLL